MILNKKKIYEIIIIFILIIISLELAIRAFLVKKEKYLFKTEEQFLFYKEKMDKLHHLRDVVGNNANFQNPEKFLFTRLIEKSENKKLILFQGDSRTRQLDEFNNELNLKIKIIMLLMVVQLQLSFHDQRCSLILLKKNII